MKEAKYLKVSMLLGSRLDKGKQDGAKTWNMDQYLLFLFGRGNWDLHFHISSRGSWACSCRNSKGVQWGVQTMSEVTYKLFRRQIQLPGWQSTLGFVCWLADGFLLHFIFCICTEMHVLTNKGGIAWQCQLRVKGRSPLVQRFPKERRNLRART